MRIGEKAAPIAGALSAVASLGCCLPLGGAAMFGLGGVLGVAAQYQEWLFPIAALLLALGGFLTWRSRRVCQRTSKASVAILGASAFVVLIVFFFPQGVAGVLADWFS